MKIQDFFQELGAKPYDKFACGSFRSIDGAIFVRQEEGTFVGDVADPDDFPILVRKLATDTVYTACEPYWVLGAVIEDDVLLTHEVFDIHRTGRNVWQTQSAREDWVRSMGKDRVRIMVKRGDPPVLKPRSRVLRNRYGMIKSILLESMEYQSHHSHHSFNWNKEELALLMPAKEWWGLAWAYAITDAAKRVVDCDTKIASSLTKVSFDNLTNLDVKLRAIREKVSASDFEEAKKLFVPLEEQVDKLQDLIHSTSHQITSAGMGMSLAKLPNQAYRLSKELDRKKNYLFGDSHYSSVQVHTKDGDNLLGSYDSLSTLFNKIGLPIPTPYGVEICPENMGQLAVLNETIKEIILTSPRDEAKTEDNKEPVPLLG